MKIIMSAFFVNIVASAKLKLSDQPAYTGMLVWCYTVDISPNALFRVKHSRIAYRAGGREFKF